MNLGFVAGLLAGSEGVAIVEEQRCHPVHYSYHSGAPSRQCPAPQVGYELSAGPELVRRSKFAVRPCMPETNGDAG